MNTSGLESFARDTRKALMDAVERKLDYVLRADTVDLRAAAAQVASLRESARRDRPALVERVAYTWFNRLAALRFLDARGWHPFGARVLTAASAGESQPELLKAFREGTLPDELAAFVLVKRLNDLLDGRLPTAIAGADPQGEVYRHLILAACRYYHDRMPFLFEALDDETELLLPDDLLTAQSIAEDFRTEISDDDCAAVEVLGWLYQFYISGKKDQVMARKSAVPSADIPAVTQLFTPHWIVRYLVENSLGRLWLLNRPNSKLRERMPYYIEDAPTPGPQPPAPFPHLERPEDIRLLDPACGSGHMLTYAFDLLYAIYAEEGYPDADIPGLILAHNLHGLEICPRATQLAQFALVCKARERNRDAFRRPIEPRVMCLQNVVIGDGELTAWARAMKLQGMVAGPVLEQLQQFRENTETFGSLIQPVMDAAAIVGMKMLISDEAPPGDLFLQDTHRKIRLVLEQAEMLSQRYQVVVANPPYMGAKQMDDKLLAFCESEFRLGFADLFSCFIERAATLTQRAGLSGLLTMQGWLFQPSFVDLRRRVFAERLMRTCLHLGAAAFDTIGGAVVQTAAFIANTGVPSDTCQFFDLTIPRGESEKEHAFRGSLSKNDPTVFRVTLDTRVLLRIPGAPAFYKNSSEMVKIFESSPSLGSLSALKAGLTTGDNVVFQRLWYEVPIENVLFDCHSLDESEHRPERWYPCSSGGDFRKWYRKSLEVVDWQNNGASIRNFTNAAGKLKSRPQNTQYYFRRGFTWNKLSTSNFAVRLQESGWIYDDTSRCGFPLVETDSDRLFAFLCSAVSSFFLSLLNPSLSFTSGDLARLPVIDSKSSRYVTKEAIEIAQADWDNFETSWDFGDQPLLRPGLKDATLEASWRNWQAQRLGAIRWMHELETQNNHLWISAYGLEGELSPEVPEDQITLARPDRRKDMAAFLSYTVGCMMGRYALDKPGLILADAGDTLEQYLATVGKPRAQLAYAPDEDGIVPVLDGEWFDDDIVARTREFLRATFGEATLEENLRFIEESLGKDLRAYFVSQFYKDHLQTYKKRPIYWLFQSPGKSFQCLVYLHRYTRDTVNRVLNRYLREYLAKLRAAISLREHTLATESASARDRTRARKEAEQYRKALRECEDWERGVLLPLAQQRVELDLDDGVKVNYLKLGEALAPIPGLAAPEEA